MNLQRSVRHSCAPMFGLSEDKIRDYLESIHISMVHNTNPVDPREASSRDILLASLNKNDGWEKLDFTEKWNALPVLNYVTTQRPKDSKNLDLKARLSKEQIDLIYDFTSGPACKYIRIYERTEVQRQDAVKESQFLRNGIASAKAKITLLDEAIAAGPKHPGIVYRGIVNMDKSYITQIFEAARNQTEFHLGTLGLPTVVSSSWNPKVALWFLENQGPKDWRFEDSWTRTKFGVFFRIHQQTGLTIDSISAIKPQEQDQEEVLIGPRARFRILGIGVLKGFEDSTLVVEMKEIKNGA